MSLSFPAAIQVDDLDHMAFNRSTEDLLGLDENFDHFVSTASVEGLEPSFFELTGAAFPGIVCPAARRFPLWILWLGVNANPSEPFQVARSEMNIAEHTSTDLMKRRTMLTWASGNNVYCASAAGLKATQPDVVDDTILLWVVTPYMFVSWPTYLEDHHLFDLLISRHRCGAFYRPREEHDRTSRTLARTKSVLLGNEPRFDSEGRDIVLLKRRNFVAL